LAQTKSPLILSNPQSIWYDLRIQYKAQQTLLILILIWKPKPNPNKPLQFIQPCHLSGFFTQEIEIVFFLFSSLNSERFFMLSFRWRQICKCIWSVDMFHRGSITFSTAWGTSLLLLFSSSAICLSQLKCKFCLKIELNSKEKPKFHLVWDK